MRFMLTVLLAMAAALRASAQGDALEARLSQVEGTVYLHLRGQPEDQYIEAQEDADLSEGDVVRTGDDGRCEITLEGPSVIDVSPNTDFTVQALQPERTIFGLSLGSFVAKIKRLTETQNMRFETPTAVAAVRGTELSVQMGGEGQPAHVGVFDEGHVAVTAPGSGSEVQIGPGQETEVRPGAAPGAPHALSALLAGRTRLAAVRQRQEFWRQNWRPRPLAQRRAMRQTLIRRRALRREELQRISPVQRRRVQAFQRRRQWQGRRQPSRQQGGRAPLAMQQRRQGDEQRRQGAQPRPRLRQQRPPPQRRLDRPAK